jgi:hypothetical protein
MLNKGLVYNTITGYRMAISEVHEQVDGSPIGSHSDISRFLQAIHKNNLPPIHSDDPIDIMPSLDYIRNLDDNISMSIRDLCIKTSFLLALVTACRPSDLRKIDLSTLRRTFTSIKLECLLPKARSHFSFTSKSSIKQIYIGLYKDDSLLCPYSALVLLLFRTEA